MSVKRPKLVGVTGRAQHGKNSVGEVLVEEHGFIQTAFADTLKEMALVLNPIIVPSTYNTRLADIVHELGWEQAKRLPEIRRFLQVLGTEAVRDMIGENAWVDALDRYIFDRDDVDDHQFVVTDVRFPNEANWVMRNQGIIIKVVRPNYENGVDPTHPSEALVDTLPYDYMVTNDKDLMSLAYAVKGIMNNEGLHPKAKWQRGVEFE